jgi:hypothetical protein
LYDIKIRRLGWTGNIVRMEDERTAERFLLGNFLSSRPVGKTKKKMGDRCPEGYITDPRNTRMEEMSRR